MGKRPRRSAAAPVHVGGARPCKPRPMDKISRRIDRFPRCPPPASAWPSQSLPECAPSPTEISPKKDNVGLNRPPHRAAAHLDQRAINGMILDRRAGATPVATRLGEFARACAPAAVSGPLVQIVHILRTEKKRSLSLTFQLGQRRVARIRLGLGTRRPARGIELPHPPGIALPGLRRTYILDPVTGPQAVFGAKGRQSPLSALMPAPVKTKTSVFGGNGKSLSWVRSFPVID